MDWLAVRKKLLRFRVIDRARPKTRGKFCWTFDGCRNADGYGSIRLSDSDDRTPERIVRGKKCSRARTWIEYAHRASAAAFNGFDLNDERDIAHACKNPSCFNPFHLDPATRSENLCMEAAGKLASNKLDEDAVGALRRYVRRHNGKANLAKFAASRRVSYATILRAVKGLTHTGRLFPSTAGSKLPRPVMISKPKRAFERRDPEPLPF